MTSVVQRLIALHVQLAGVVVQLCLSYRVSLYASAACLNSAPCKICREDLSVLLIRRHSHTVAAAVDFI